ncbi:MAG: N-acetyl-gamma-glutamyl-phosphate reductase [Oscillospiraceae bacterium]
MTKVFIDGSAGTTGLRIHERLSGRKDIELISIPQELRKDKKAREEAINAADVAFFCLPDAAAIEAASLVHGSTAVIDTSTAHRTNPDWDYGFPELKGRREKMRLPPSGQPRLPRQRLHLPGGASGESGHHTGRAEAWLLSLTGYSGGGKKMIAEYEDPGRSPFLSAPRQYALGQQHRHLKEMTLISGLEEPPVFCPIVADYYSGMEVTVPLFRKDIKGDISDISEVYREYYSSGLVHFETDDPEGGLLSGAALSGRDDMEIRVAGCDERILLISHFDNLGKGASGAAIQNMNLILGLDEKTGLVI